MEKIKIFSKKIFVQPIINILITLRIPPNSITISSIVFSLIAFFTYKKGNFWLGGIFLFLSSILDTFDGEIARRTNQVTKIGGFLDSTIDRINEFLVYQELSNLLLKE